MLADAVRHVVGQKADITSWRDHPWRLGATKYRHGEDRFDPFSKIRHRRGARDRQICTAQCAAVRRRRGGADPTRGKDEFKQSSAVCPNRPDKTILFDLIAKRRQRKLIPPRRSCQGRPSDPVLDCSSADHLSLARCSGESRAPRRVRWTSGAARRRERRPTAIAPRSPTREVPADGFAVRHPERHSCRHRRSLRQTSRHVSPTCA
jgi:hypothetical protein